MKISLPEFTLEKVDFFDEQHIRYIEGLITDPEVERFLPYFKNGLYISKNIGFFIILELLILFVTFLNAFIILHLLLLLN